MALPDESWAGNRKNIELGGKTIELHYFGMNHGLGMTVFRLPKEKIVFIADLVTPNRLLFTIVPDFNVKQWLRTLKEIEEMDFKTAIFTHGDPVIGTKKDVAGNREFIEDMYNEWLPMNAWRLLLDDWMGPFPWRPNHPYEVNK